MVVPVLIMVRVSWQQQAGFAGWAVDDCSGAGAGPLGLAGFAVDGCSGADFGAG